MAFKIVRNDITKMKVDAIVNTANEAPVYGEGVDTAVYEAAGIRELLAERQKIGFLNQGEVAITPGFNLPAKYVIHAVSPLYTDGENGEEELLRSCYRKSLNLAYEYKCESIAFPLISTGSFGYPKEEGMRIAVDEINAFLLKHNMMIYLVVFDTEATRLGKNLYPNLEEYIDHNYVCDKKELEYSKSVFASAIEVDPEVEVYRQKHKPMEKFLRSPLKTENVRFSPPKRRNTFSSSIGKKCYEEADLSETVDIDEDLWEENESALEERMRHMSDTFQQYLLYLIELKGLTNAEVYKRAIISKQLFSKIKVKKDYHPDKATAMRLCVGAKLNLDETRDLLARAGYALSPCDKRDIIFSFFIEKEIFDMIEIDIALEEHGLPCFIE